MKEPENIVVMITAGSSDEGQTIADELTKQRKAACVSVIRNVQSFFWWEGKIDTAQEVLLIAKTRAAELGGLIELVKELHSYDVPEIIALPIVGGNQDYLDWIKSETKK
ncbi:MAG: divalent-cation tolerance protein CutA [Deltaproteobacteria bacterium]|nr:MAG: divalent-cation tolerance protein CutA [Deltaproteobacteria bacterium]